MRDFLLDKERIKVNEFEPKTGLVLIFEAGAKGGGQS